MKQLIVGIVVGSMTLFSTGCGLNGSTLAVGGAGGAAAGATTGLVVASIMSNGDLGASTLLGTAIGLPAGLALAAYIDYTSESSVKGRRLDEIEVNQREIFEKQREIEAMREQLRDDGPIGNPVEELKDYHYSGASLGRY